MPAKRKQKQTASCQSSSMHTRRKQTKSTMNHSLLDLPLEVRQLIYEFCYLDPHPLKSLKRFDQPNPGATSEPKSKKRRLQQHAIKPGLQQKIVTNCHLPQSHPSLGSVCRQIRHEYFPIFTRHHIFSISDPLIFANEYLSYNPPHRYSNIRSLAIDWEASIPECGCQPGPGAICQYHPVKYPPVLHDAQNLLKMVDAYPELFDPMESIRLTMMPVFFGVGTSSGAFYECIKLMFKHAVLLVEKMDRGKNRGTVDSDGQRYILAIKSDMVNLSSIQVSIFAVADDIWDSLADGSPLCQKVEENEVMDAGRRTQFLRFENFVNWNNIDDFTTAVRDGTLYSQTPHEADAEKRDPSECEIAGARQMATRNWKVVFNNTSIPRSWHIAVSELGLMKGRRPDPSHAGFDPEFYCLD